MFVWKMDGLCLKTLYSGDILLAEDIDIKINDIVIEPS